VAIAGGLISPFVVTREMAFAVHGTAELTFTGAAQVVGTLLVLSLAITPGAAAQRLTASPLVVAGLSMVSPNGDSRLSMCH
jgi:ABC-type Mn2+/Zn2+ transport system permease subunit